MASEKPYHGALVAFEGTGDVVSTQLRLLPTSPQVLILPDVQHYMQQEKSTRFNARTYIKDVQKAVQARHEVALQFLKDSSRNSKRLVFLNGGTASAVALCISTISERESLGDTFRAESMFRTIAREGMRGLGSPTRKLHQESLQKLSGEQDRDVVLEHRQEDPTTKAMRAADALYRETESLQPVDCYIRMRPRSLSMSMLGYTNDLGEASPFFVFGSPSNGGTRSPPDMDESERANHFRDEVAGRSRASRASSLGISMPDRSSNPIAGELIRSRNSENWSTLQLTSPTTDNCLSPPLTPEGVVFGEARLVQMQASRTTRPLRKTRSLDDTELVEARRRRHSIQATPAPQKVLLTESPGAKSPDAKSRHLSIVEDPYSSNNLLHLPQARFVKAQTTTIKRSPTFKAVPELTSDTYAPHGTNAEVADENNKDKLARQESFSPVLPLIEDLVLHFTSEHPEDVLDSVVQSFKTGWYPVVEVPSDSYGIENTDSCPSTPRTADLFDLEDKFMGLSPVIEVPSRDEASDYDPYSSRAANFALHPSTPHPKLALGRLPTPAQTPLLTAPETVVMGTQFHMLAMAGHANAIATQNALRLVLERYFPTQEGGYYKYNPMLLHGLDSLWKPIFGDSETSDGTSTKQTADLILAIGGQKDVKRDFLCALTGQVEKLGVKPNGMSRSGRLDIRYLIANAVQSFSTQSLMNTAQSNLLENPQLLSCSIVPHLETYLATTTTTRFLVLEYPSEHLATVLALQKLIGTEIFKVAGVINAKTISPVANEGPAALQINTSRSNPVARPIDTISLPGSPFPNNNVMASTNSTGRGTIAHRRRISFSKANYVLASSATEAEIGMFISKIWKDLIDVDRFYEPEQPPRMQAVHGHAHTLGSKPSLPSLVSRFTPPYSPPSSSHGVHPDDPTAVARALFSGAPSTPPPGMPLPLPPRSASPRPGSSRTVMTTASTARDTSPSRSTAPSSAGSGLRSPHYHYHYQQQQQLLQSHTAIVPQHIATIPQQLSPSAWAASMAEDGDLYDEEERRLMPMYIKQSEMRKGSSRKALRWLGLA